MSQWNDGLPKIDEDTMPGELANVVAGRVANLLDLQGQITHRCRMCIFNGSISRYPGQLNLDKLTWPYVGQVIEQWMRLPMQNFQPLMHYLHHTLRL